VATVNCGRLTALAVVLCWATCGSPIAYADWAACQSRPTRSCLIEEALRGESGPLTGKDRLDVLLDAGVLDHIEEATAADIKEAQRLASGPSPGRYRLLAVQGLAAANQWEEAFELVRSSSGSLQSLAFAGLIRAMVKAGKQDEIAGLGMRMPRPFDINNMITEIVKALAAAGRMDDVLSVVAGVQGKLPELGTTDMLMAVAQAYVERGDIKTASRFFDKAEAIATAGLQIPVPNIPVLPYDPIQLRFALISLWALRGNTAAVKAALQQLPPPSDSNSVAPTLHTQGYQRVVVSLLQAKQFPLALEVAKSMPGAALHRDAALASVALACAKSGRIDDARAVLSSFGEKTNPRMRAAVIQALAFAQAKAGDAPSAVQMTAQISDPMSRRAALLTLARALPR
jgi:hypothetical protein